MLTESLLAVTVKLGEPDKGRDRVGGGVREGGGKGRGQLRSPGDQPVKQAYCCHVRIELSGERESCLPLSQRGLARALATSPSCCRLAEEPQPLALDPPHVPHKMIPYQVTSSGLGQAPPTTSVSDFLRPATKPALPTASDSYQNLAKVSSHIQSLLPTSAPAHPRSLVAGCAGEPADQDVWVDSSSRAGRTQHRNLRSETTAR